MATRQSYRAVAQNPTGAPLNRWREWLEIVVPEATTNLFLNPSWETNTSNWTATSDGSSGTPYDRTTARQFKGAYSAVLTVRPTSGTFVQIVGQTVTSGQDYTISFHVRRPSGGLVRSADVRAVVNGASTTFDRIYYVADGWYRCEKSYRASSTSAPGIRVQGSPGAIFYVDAAQLENKLYTTTYCDGDQVGLLAAERVPPYLWNGPPHASTSTRSAITRSGGRIVNVTRYGLTILALIGLGLSQRSVISTPLGLLDGSLYQRTVRESRVFTVAGAFEARDPRYLSAQRGALRALLSHDLTGQDQPAVLYLQRHDDAEPIGDQVLIAASYLEGLEEETTQVFSETVSMQFQQFLPLLVSAADRGTALDTGDSTASANFIIERRADGSWNAFSSSPNNEIGTNALIFGPDNKLYAGGAFTTPGTRVARYNFESAAWETLSTGLAQQVNALAFSPDGLLFAGLDAAVTIGPRTGSVVYWDGSAWAVYGTGNSDRVNAVVVGGNGVVYAGGTSGGNATLRSIALTTGPTGAWTTITAAVAGSVVDLEYTNSLLYIAGNFANLGGVAAADGVAVYNGAAISGVNSSSTGVRSLSSDPAGNLYAIGVTTGGYSFYNGTSWQDISGIELLGSSTNSILEYDRIRSVLIAAEAEQTSLAVGTGFVVATNGAGSFDILSNLSLVTVSPAILSTVRAYASNGSRQVFATNTGGAQSVGGRATISNPGTVPASWRARLTNSSTTTARRFYQIENVTNGGQATFNLTLYPGESVIITVDAAQPRIVSDRRGDLTTQAVIGAVDWSRLLLLKGSNTIMALAENSTDVTGAMWLTPQYESFDDATRAP